jgi:hypothetical protein
MSTISPRVRAGLVLAATLLPLCTFAAPLRVRLVRAESLVTDVPELNTAALQERSLYGLTQATKADSEKAEMLPAGALESPDVVVGTKLSRNGTKYRLVYTFQTVQQPRLTKQLAYEFAQPKLSDRGVTVMSQEVITEAVKLEATRKSRAAEQGSAPVAAAPTPPPSTPSAPESQASTAPVAVAPSQPQPSAVSNQPEPSVSASQPEPQEDPVAERERRAADWKARKPWHQLDVGAAAGFNSPSGVYGLEVEYRPLQYVGLILGGGSGAWGNRITPGARLYPLGISGASLFLEGGMSINTGGEASVSINDGPEQIVDLLVTPVATTSVGVRFNIDRIYFTPRVGWGFRMRQDNYRTRDGSEINPLFDAALGLFQHGGFLISLTIGATFL